MQLHDSMEARILRMGAHRHPTGFDSHPAPVDGRREEAMMVMLLIGAVVLFCFGGLVGAAWTAEILGGISRRHAGERRSLNDGWRALAEARRARGEPAHCARCHRDLAESGWALFAAAEEDDDGT
jgi:hypothetical protein